MAGLTMPGLAAAKRRFREIFPRGFADPALFPDKESTRDFAHEKNTKAPEGAAAGAGTGVVLGGALGWLVGIGALAIPGLGPFIAAGPIVAALAGAGVGGTVGGITGALIGLGIPEFEAKRYEGMIKSGGILLSVHCDNAEWRKKAKDILERNKLDAVSTADEARADTKSQVGLGNQKRHDSKHI